MCLFFQPFSASDVLTALAGYFIFVYLWWFYGDLFYFFQALNVGIFPYVLRLLQSPARDVRPLMVFIWAKILAVDSVSGLRDCIFVFNVYVAYYQTQNIFFLIKMYFLFISVSVFNICESTRKMWTFGKIVFLTLLIARLLFKKSLFCRCKCQQILSSF